MVRYLLNSVRILWLFSLSHRRVCTVVLLTPLLIPAVWGFPMPVLQFSDTSWVSNSSMQFQHYPELAQTSLVKGSAQDCPASGISSKWGAQITHPSVWLTTNLGFSWLPPPGLLICYYRTQEHTLLSVCQFIMEDTTGEQPNRRAKRGGRSGAELPSPLWACLPPSMLMCLPTPKLSESLFKSCYNQSPASYCPPDLVGEGWGCKFPML